MLMRRNTLMAGITSLATIGSLGLLPVDSVLGGSAKTDAQKVAQTAPKPTLQVAQPAQSTKSDSNQTGFIPAHLGRSTNPFTGRNVFGKDDRIPMTTRKHPWSAIGRVEAFDKTGKGWICTGTLIGKNLAVTNAHCVLDEKTGKLTTNPLRFRPNLINGKSSSEASITKVVVGTQKVASDRGNDWAILTLDRPLGEQYGWMGWMIVDFADLDGLRSKFILAGYSADFPTDNPGATAGVHEGCSIRGFTAPGVVSHDCDMTRGASGGPIFAFLDGNPMIVALNSAQRTTSEGEKVARFSAQTANVGVSTASWASTAQALLKQSRR